jgi:hypothetical protein
MSLFLQYLKKLNGQTFKIVAVLIVVVFLFWLYGCQSTTLSMLEANRSVTRSELEAEAVVLNARYAKKVADLDLQDQIKSAAIEAVSPLASGGGVNFSGLLTSILGIAAVGYGIDAKRQANNAIAKIGNSPK